VRLHHQLRKRRHKCATTEMVKFSSHLQSESRQGFERNDLPATHRNDMTLGPSACRHVRLGVGLAAIWWEQL